MAAEGAADQRAECEWVDIMATFLSAVPDTPAPSGETNSTPSPLESALAGHIRRVFEVNKEARRDVEREMMDALRQRNGEYTSNKLADIKAFGGSEVYLPLTTMQCVAASSLIMDIVAPAGRRGWSAEPTTEPEVPQEWVEQVSQQMRGEIEQMQQPPPPEQQPPPPEQQMQPPPPEPPTQEQVDERGEQLLGQVKEMLNQQAKDAMLRMEERIEDQLLDSGWDDALEDFVDDFVTFPAAFIKTIVRRKKELEWRNGQLGVAEKTTEQDVRVSPFNIFPSPGQVTIDDGDLIEKVEFTRAGLYEMLGEDDNGYKSEAIRQVLTEYSDGGLRDWTSETDEEQRDAERKGRDHLEDGLIAGVHYWGKAQGLHLLQWGMDPEYVDDALREYEIDAIVIGSHVIRASLNDDAMGRRPYYKASYRNRPGSFWGLGIPWMIRHHAELCNATARALSNNLGVASGPQVMVLVDRLPKGQEISSVTPLKIWQMTSDPAGSTQLPIQFFQPQSNAQELLGVLQFFWEQVADITGIHRIAYGSTTDTTGTARGDEQALQQATKTIKSAVRHIDRGVIEARVRRQYDENMLYDPDPEIKGDAKIRAAGSKALSEKTEHVKSRSEFLAQTANPMDSQILGIGGRAQLLRKIAEDIGLDIKLPSPKEVEAKMAEQEANQPPDPALEVAKIRAESQMQGKQMDMEDEEKDRALRWEIAQLEAQREQIRLRSKADSDLGKSKVAIAQQSMKNASERQKIADHAMADRLPGVQV